LSALRFSLVLFFLCGLAIWQVTQIPKSTLYDAVGVSLVPIFVVSVIFVFSLFYFYQTILGNSPDVASSKLEKPLKNPDKRLRYFLGGFACFVFLVNILGFIISATLCGIAIAKSFDEKISKKSIVISFLIASTIWILFSIILSVNLGPAFFNKKFI